MKKSNGIDPKLNDALEELKSVPARDPETAARGRARFLAEAASLRAAQRSVQSRAVQPRRFALNAFAAVIVILVLFFGGSVGAVYAAQDALPGDTLYPLKLWSEETRLDLVSDPDAEIDLLMQFVQVRVTEMNELAAQGIVPPAETGERAEQQIRTAIELAAGMEDEPMQAALLRIRTQLEARNESLIEGTSEQVQTIFRVQLQRVEDGLTNPVTFRNTIHNQEQAGQTPTRTPAQSTPPPRATTTGNGSGAGETPTPGGGQSPTTGPHNPEITPGPTQGPGGQSTPEGNGGGKP